MSDYPENPIREENEESKEELVESKEDSGYRFVQPQTESFTDASYIPQDQAPRIPRSYAYAEPELRENRRSWEKQEKQNREEKRERRGMGAGAVIALCLVCVLLGIAAGLLTTGALSERISERISVRSAEEEETLPEEILLPAEEENETTVSEEDGKTAEAETAENVQGKEGTVYLASDTEVNEELAGVEIYEIACRQVVGISTEVTYQSRYGTQSGTVTGSGFIIHENGYVLTNYHVVEYAAEGGYPITVMLYNGDSYPARIVGYEDDDSDVAVLKIDAEGLDAATLGDSNSIRVGETVYAVGNPLGELDYTMTRGMISAMGREITTTSENGIATTINMFQIDAAVNSGNSGGPVYNGEGEVIGIVTAKYSDSYAEMGIEGLGFAIPIDDALTIANDLIQNGYVRGKAYMGIYSRNVSKAAVQYYGMAEGAYIYTIEPGSCAERFGLKLADIITAVDDYAVLSVSDLLAALKNYSAGDSAVLTVFRSGETEQETGYLEITIVFDEKKPETNFLAPESAMENSYQPSFGYGGPLW